VFPSGEKIHVNIEKGVQEKKTQQKEGVGRRERVQKKKVQGRKGDKNSAWKDGEHVSGARA